MSVIGIIPARMGSRRFPGKPLKTILGIPMVGHCYYRTVQALGIENTYVATCDKEIVEYIKKLQHFKFSILKTKSFKETNILKLNSIKAKKKLSWFSKWNLAQSLEKTLEWNKNTKKGISAKDMCERQFLMYLNKK